MILVTGASGNVGGSVLKELLSRGTANIRVMCRSENDLAALPKDVEGVRADFADSLSLDKALSGIVSAYLVCSPVPDLVKLETNFLLAAKRANLKHLVINSALGAEDFPKTFPSWHRKVEDKAKELKLDVAILRPNGFMQNIAAYFAPTIRAQDAFYGTIGDARISFIDVRDVATAVVNALLDQNTAGKTFELSGPRAWSYPEVADELSKVTGRPIKYVNLSTEQMKSGMLAAGMPLAQVTAVLELDDYYRSGKGAASEKALRSLLGGRAPRTLETYLAENAGAFAKSNS